MLNQNQNAVNPSRDLFVLNKSVNKIRAFNAAIPSDFSTVTKPDAARIKKEALELVDLVSYALNQRGIKIDVLDDEKKRIETTKHTSIVYYSLNLIAAQLETTAREISKKIETETTEPTTTTETTEPTTKTVEPEPDAILELSPISDAVKNDDADLIDRALNLFERRAIKAADIVPNMIEESIKRGCPLWSKKWFSFAEFPRKYFDGARYSFNNAVILGGHCGFYISDSEARRILGAGATPKPGAISRRVLMPVFLGSKSLKKKDLDALRNGQELDDDDKKGRPDFYRLEKVWDQTAFEGLPIKKTRELPNNPNARNARAEKVLSDFCAANNIVFRSDLGCGQAVCAHVIDPKQSININVPHISQFKSAAAYYATVFHECSHAANRRNGCQLTEKREELAAEIGACVVLNSLGFDSAEYIDDIGAYVRRFRDTASEKNAIKKAWKYAQSAALLILKSYIEEDDDAVTTTQEEAPAPVETKEETKEETAPAPVVRNDDEEEIVAALDEYEDAAQFAAETGGIVHADAARAAEKQAADTIEQARINGSVDDDALEVYTEKVETIRARYVVRYDETKEYPLTGGVEITERGAL